MKYKLSKYIHVTICFILLTFAMTLFMISKRNFDVISEKIVEFDENNVNSLYLKVYDIYGQNNQKSLSEFFKEDNSLERLKLLCKTLNKEFNYFEFDSQSLLIKDKFNYKDEFRIDYGREDYGFNDNIGISLKSVQIGANTYKEFDIDNKIYSGVGFSSENFLYDNVKPIPAILGNEYKDTVKIGDMINFEYLSKKITVEVIGFLEIDSIITLNNQIYYLDRYIIVPLIDTVYNPANNDEEMFQNILYSQKNWGYIKIKTGDNYLDYKNKITQISKNLNLKYEISEGYIHPYIKNISNTINSTKGLFLIASIILFVIFSLIYIYIYIWKFNKNRKIYAIHMISGCSFIKLKTKIFIEILLEFIAALFTATTINKLIFNYRNLSTFDKNIIQLSMQSTTLLSIVIMVLICLILNKHINKNEIYYSISKEN